MGFLTDAISAVVSSVSSFCTGIGGSIMTGIGSFMGSVISPLPKLFPLFTLGEVIKTVVRIITSVVDALTEKPKEETPEELGLRAETAEKKPEDFHSTTEYIEYLRNDIEIDKERLNEIKMDEAESAKYATVGAGLYVRQVEEKYGMKLPPEFWHDTFYLRAEGKISEEMPADLIKFMKEHGINDGAVFSYFRSGHLNPGSEEQENMYDALMDTYRKEYPNATDDELSRKIDAL